MKNISNEWNNMTIQDKDKYYTISKQLKEKYNIELTKWKENMIKTGHADLLKSNTESKHDSSISKYEKQDSECPNQSNTKTTESITDFSNIKIQNKDDIKTGWGTDTTNSTADIPHGNNGNRPTLIS